jgi:hypothetical protein
MQDTGRDPSRRGRVMQLDRKRTVDWLVYVHVQKELVS